MMKIFFVNCTKERLNEEYFMLLTTENGVVHAYVDQKLLKSNKIKSFNQCG